MNTITKSTCGMCYAGCGVLVSSDKGKVTKITGDPQSPVNKGKLCAKGRAAIEYLYHPDRLKYPLKRMGKKGAGKWRQISWEEAAAIIADELLETKEKHGAEAIAYIQGAAKGLQDSYGERFANVFGTPNFSTTGHICFAPRVFASLLTYGFNAVPDYDFPPACIILWGANLKETRKSEHRQLKKASKKGARLIVVDPRRTRLAAKAQIHLQVKPGADLALVLGMIHVIINENLIDHEFVEQWCAGFEQLAAHIEEYSPAIVEKLTWVPKEQIRETARLYAHSKPAAIQWGNAIDQTVDSFQTARAIAILRAITGNIGIPGGDVRGRLPLLEWTSAELVARHKLPPAQWDKRLNASEPLIPLFRRVPSQYIVKAILTGEPYPLRKAFIQGANPLLTYSSAADASQAFQQLEFLAAADHFMTPTAALADIVLPVTTYLEFDNIVAPPYYPVAQAQQQVTRIAERRSDYEIINLLARKMGIDKHFWSDPESFFDYLLKPVGLTFAEFKQTGSVTGEKQYRSQQEDYFNTSTGKVELYSEQLNQWGFAPLPACYLPPAGVRRTHPLTQPGAKPKRISNIEHRILNIEGKSNAFLLLGSPPEGARAAGLEKFDQNFCLISSSPGESRFMKNNHENSETAFEITNLSEAYPFLLTTCKSRFYRHSGGRQIPSLRRKRPQPAATIHPRTAKQLKIKKGEWIYIETPQGKIKQKVNFSSHIDPRVVIADFGWWFPEKGVETLYGWQEANVNLLTGSQPPYNREMGSTHLRGVPCKISTIT